MAWTLRLSTPGFNFLFAYKTREEGEHDMKRIQQAMASKEPVLIQTDAYSACVDSDHIIRATLDRDDD